MTVQSDLRPQIPNHFGAIAISVSSHEMIIFLKNGGWKL